MRNRNEDNNLGHPTTHTKSRSTYTARRGRVNRQARAHASACDTPSARKAFLLFVPVTSQRPRGRQEAHVAHGPAGGVEHRGAIIDIRPGIGPLLARSLSARS